MIKCDRALNRYSLFSFLPKQDVKKDLTRYLHVRCGKEPRDDLQSVDDVCGLYAKATHLREGT